MACGASLAAVHPLLLSDGALNGGFDAKLKSLDSGASLCSLATGLPDDSDAESLCDSYVDAIFAGEPAGDCDQRTSDVAPSVPKSRYSDPGETLIFLDWDDTLFPTTELFDRRKIPKESGDVPSDVYSSLGPWREALEQFLLAACSRADRCVILTNARKRWVETCIRRFAPGLEPLLKLEKLRVVYSEDALRRHTYESWSGRVGPCIAGLKVLWASIYEWDEEELDIKEREALRTRRKAAGMASEGASYYRARTWENVLSFGDATYERDAVRALASSSPDQAAKASRVKDITVPRAASLEALTRSLQLSTLFLHTFVNFNGCFSVDIVRNSRTPLSVKMLSRTRGR